MSFCSSFSDILSLFLPVNNSSSCCSIIPRNERITLVSLPTICLNLCRDLSVIDSQLIGTLTLIVVPRDRAITFAYAFKVLTRFSRVEFTPILVAKNEYVLVQLLIIDAFKVIMKISYEDIIL